VGDLVRMLVPDLKSYLMDRGIIPYYMFHIQKRRIISLGQGAFGQELDVLTTR